MCCPVGYGSGCRFRPPPLGCGVQIIDATTGLPVATKLTVVIYCALSGYCVGVHLQISKDFEVGDTA